VNELEFLRQQIATERGHMAAVRSACATALEQAGTPPDPEFLGHCADYLVFIVARFNEQDRTHAGQIRPRLDVGDDAGRRAIDDLLGALEQSRAAISRLATAAADWRGGRADDAALVAALREYLAFYASVLATRRHSLQPWFDAHYGIAEWRRAAGVDADSILEERERYARVADSLPEGLSLAPSQSSATALRAAARSAAAPPTAAGPSWTSSPNPPSTP